MYPRVDFRLMMITDTNMYSNNSIKRKVAHACELGVRAVQFRDKISETLKLLSISKELRAITSKYSAKLLVNDRADIALLSKADGVHIPSNYLDINPLLRYKLILGKSVHSLKEAKKAYYDRFDYILFGPVFETESKIKYGKPQGLVKLKNICKKIKIPVFAVGGITPERANSCLNAGAHGIAVINAIVKSNNLKNTISEFKKYIGVL